MHICSHILEEFAALMDSSYLGKKVLVPMNLDLPPGIDSDWSNSYSGLRSFSVFLISRAFELSWLKRIQNKYID